MCDGRRVGLLCVWLRLASICVRDDDVCVCVRVFCVCVCFCECTRYDPLRKARMSFTATLTKLGWPYIKEDTITEGVTVLASLKDKYVAFEVCVYLVERER